LFVLCGYVVLNNAGALLSLASQSTDQEQHHSGSCRIYSISIFSTTLHVSPCHCYNIVWCRFVRWQLL